MRRSETVKIEIDKPTWERFKTMVKADRWHGWPWGPETFEGIHMDRWEDDPDAPANVLRSVLMSLGLRANSES
jgi:hypothetical protein